jgi:transposase
MDYTPQTLALWQRRARAIEMIEDGETKADVASELGVAERVVFRWWARYRKNPRSLAPVAPHGQVPKLAESKVFAVFDWLDNRGRLTLKDAAERIERSTASTTVPPAFGC